MTSIEWLINKLEEQGDMRESPSIRNLQLNIDTSDYLELKRQAKEMHRKELEDEFNKGWKSGYDRCIFDSKNIQDSDTKEDWENSSGFYQKNKKD